MEPICGQAYGAKMPKLLGITVQRTILLLLLTSILVLLLWLNMERILLLCGQEESIVAEAQSYILYCLPDLVLQSFLHPIRIYLRSQGVTMPLTGCTFFAILLHIPINYMLVVVLNLGVKGVSLSTVWTNFNLILFLVAYIMISCVHKSTWPPVSVECLKGWGPLVRLALPSCVSVCLEWWWYEIIILLCGLLSNPQAAVASMGVLIQTTALIYIFPSSLSFGVSTRVGNKLGAGKPEKAKLATVVGFSLGFILGFTALCFTITVRNSWAKLFTEDSNIIALTSAVLPIIGLCELGNCPQTTGCGVLRGTARPKMGANINLGCFYTVGMPVALCLGFFTGYNFKGLWLGLLAAQASCAASMLFVVARTNWEHEAQRAKELTAGCVEGVGTTGEDHRADYMSSQEEDQHDDLLVWFYNLLLSSIAEN